MDLNHFRRSLLVFKQAFLFFIVVGGLITSMPVCFADLIVLRGDEGVDGAHWMTAQMPQAGIPALATAPLPANHFGNAPHQGHVERSANSHYPGGIGRHDERPTTTVRVPEHKTYFQEHPKVRAALIGAGAGTAAGAVTGLVTHKGVIRGAAIGAGAGAGVGLIRSSDTLKKHPIVKDLATGAVTGLGLGMASSHRAGKIGEFSAVGAAVGLGVGVLKDKLK